jgi:hypothetical protein
MHGARQPRGRDLIFELAEVILDEILRAADVSYTRWRCHMVRRMTASQQRRAVRACIIKHSDVHSGAAVAQEPRVPCQ